MITPTSTGPNPITLQIVATARAIGCLDRTRPVDSYTSHLSNTIHAELPVGVGGKLGDLSAAGVPSETLGYLTHFASGNQGLGEDGRDLLAHLRVAERTLGEYQRTLTERAAASTKPVLGVDDARITELFERHRAALERNEVPILPSAHFPDLEDPRQGFDPIREQKTGTELLWIREPADLGELSVAVAPYWMAGSVGMALYRNLGVGSLGAVMMTGLARNTWNPLQSGGKFCLGGVMCEGGIGFGDVVDKANDMIKWEVINAILGMDTQLGPGKSLIIPGRFKQAALPIHAVAMRFVGAYIGGNDEGVGPEEAALISALAPKNFAGSAVAHERLRGLFPSPYTASGVNQFLLGTLHEHVNDLTAPIAFQGFGGVGSVLIQIALRQGLRIAGIIEGDVSALKRAAVFLNREWGGLREVPLILDVDATRLLCKGDGVRVDAHVKEAERAGFTVVDQGGLAACLARLDEMGRRPIVVSPNAHAHIITEEVLKLAKDLHIAAFVGGANNPLQYQRLAALAVQNNVFIPWGPMANPLGATVVLRDALQLTPLQIERGILSLYHLFERSLKAHRSGVSPLEDGQRMVAESWNPKLDDGRAAGPRYGG